MIIVFNKNGNIDQLVRSYKSEVDKLNFIKEVKSRARYEKPSTKRRKMLNTAKKTQRYKIEHNLV